MDSEVSTAITIATLFEHIQNTLFVSLKEVKLHWLILRFLFMNHWVWYIHHDLCQEMVLSFLVQIFSKLFLPSLLPSICIHLFLPSSLQFSAEDISLRHCRLSPERGDWICFSFATYNTHSLWSGPCSTRRHVCGWTWICWLQGWTLLLKWMIWDVWIHVRLDAIKWYVLIFDMYTSLYI